MKVTINANGTTIQAEICEEQLKELGLIEEQPIGYERVKKGDVYYFNITRSETVAEVECNRRIDEGRYDTGNYYSDKTIAENNARADRLHRQLRQWQGLNDKAITKKDWKGYDVIKYNIDYDYLTNRLLVRWTGRYRKLNVVYFTSEEKAEKAIKVFEDELLWYFTKYVQRLDEVQCNG